MVVVGKCAKIESLQASKYVVLPHIKVMIANFSSPEKDIAYAGIVEAHTSQAVR